MFFGNRHNVVLRATKTGYEPYDDRALRQHSKLKEGELVGARVAKSRSLQHHRLYWKVLECAVDATGFWSTAEELHNVLKIATGQVEILQTLDGELLRIPNSTSFEKMNQEEFAAYCNDAFRLLSDKLDMSVEELLDEAKAA